MTKVSIHQSQTTCRILEVSGKRVILDSDLAALYGVATKRLNEQVRRSPVRFPQDFAFLLSSEEWDSLRSQFATLKAGGCQHRRFLPYVFTGRGALRAAEALNSPQAIAVSIYVVRIFIAMRDALETNQQLSRCFDELEHTIERRLTSHDRAIADILAAIRALMNPPKP